VPELNTEREKRERERERTLSDTMSSHSTSAQPPELSASRKKDRSKRKGRWEPKLLEHVEEDSVFNN